MKKSKFKQILDESSITLKESRNVVIDRLMEQNGICRNDTTQGSGLYFECKNNGKFWIDSFMEGGRGVRRNFFCYVEGEVLEENGKTVVKYYSVNNRIWKIVTYITVIISAIYFIGSLILMGYLDSGISIKIAIAILPMVIVYVAIFSELRKYNKYKNVDFEIMKQEAINRVEAIKYWDK